MENNLYQYFFKSYHLSCWLRRCTVALGVVMALFLASSLSSQGLSTGSYSMDALRQRNWQDTAMKVEGFVRERPQYSSFRLSFVADGYLQYALVSIPQKYLSGAVREDLPVIFLLHGYIPPAAYSTERSYPVVFARYANSEFIVVKPDYRGHDRSEGRAEAAKAGALNKLLYVVDNLQLLHNIKSQGLNWKGAQYRVSPEKIFLMGHSNGGELSLRMLEIQPQSFRAASLWAPVSVSVEESSQFYGRKHGNFNKESWEKSIKAAYQMLGVAEPKDLDYQYAAQLQRISSPLRIHHAASDKSVPIAWTQALRSQLDRATVSYEFFDYPGDDHNLSKNQAAVQASDLRWFRSFLGK